MPCRFNCPKPPVPNCTQKIDKHWFTPTDWLVDVYDEKTNTIVKKSHMQVDAATGFVNVTIPCDWNMIINADPSASVAGTAKIIAHNITVIGILTVDITITELTLSTKSLNIHTGQFIVGTKDARFAGKFHLELMGIRVDDPLYTIDEFVDVGNKVISVIGALRLYGKAPATTAGRLTKNIAAGDFTFTVDSADGWEVGHEIVLSASGRNASHYDRRTIKSISVANGVTTVEVETAFSFFHHGAAAPSITKALGPSGASIEQSLDLRSEVVHLTRNIVISGTDEDNWGGRILVYLWSGAGFAFRGQVELDGVELINMGQRDSGNAGLDFRALGRATGVDYSSPSTQTDRSFLRNSAVHDCAGVCLKSEDSEGWDVENSVFF